MSADHAPNADLHAMLEIPAGERAAALERWLATQPDDDHAARILARTLAAMDKTPRGRQTELAHFLAAEKLRFPLDDAAGRCGDEAVQSDLWAHASTSAAIVGEVAELPYAYARQAVRANPTGAAAWGAFREALRSDHTDVFTDIEGWIARAGRGGLPADMGRRALAAARAIAAEESWTETDRARLAGLASALR
jgi:hypothetical protein